MNNNNGKSNIQSIDDDNITIKSNQSLTLNNMKAEHKPNIEVDAHNMKIDREVF